MQPKWSEGDSLVVKREEKATEATGRTSLFVSDVRTVIQTGKEKGQDASSIQSHRHSCVANASS